MKYTVMARMNVGGAERMSVEEFEDFEEAFKYASEMTKAMNTIYMMDEFTVELQGA